MGGDTLFLSGGNPYYALQLIIILTKKKSNDVLCT